MTVVNTNGAALSAATSMMKILKIWKMLWQNYLQAIE